MFKNLRQSVLVLIAACFLAFGVAASAETNSQTSNKSAKSTPKKNAKPTATPAKKAQAKNAPASKKTTTATSAKSKTPDKKTADKKTADKKSADKKSIDKKLSAAKNNSKDKNAKSARENSKNSKNTKNTKDVKQAAKNSSSKSKEKFGAKTVSKADAKNKNSKSETRPRESKTTTAKNTGDKKTSRKTESVTTAKTPSKTDETNPDSDAPQVVVTEAIAPVRASASAKAAEVNKLKLGTILNVAQKNASWYKVEYANGAKTSVGWIPASAVGSFDAVNKPQIYMQVANRYYKPQMDFATSSALYEFLTRNQSDYENSDAASDLQLKRLLALRSALQAIPVGEKDNQPYKDFLRAHGKEIVYSEPSGEYVIVSNLFWDLHKKYKNAPNADQIAWEAAQNPLPGECEGYVNCHLFYARMTSGEYLNLHPTGKHSLEALTNLTNLLEPIIADLEKKQIYSGPTDVTDRAEFNNLIAELRTIVSRLPLTEKEKTLQQLKKVAESFR